MKYCEYYEDTGHTTEDYFNLKKLIEKLIKDGELKKFFAKYKLQRKEARDKKTEIQGKINTITGGSVLGQSTKTAKKNYAREIYNFYKKSGRRLQSDPIMFTQDDFEGITWPHEDPFIFSCML